MNKPSLNSDKSPGQTAEDSAPKQEQSTDSLLNELESIKDLLDESSLDENELDSDLNIDIPILDDVVPGEANQQQASGDLLDLKAIFDDEDEAPLQADIAPAAPSSIDQADSGETQLNFDGLDIDVDIPSFKLSLQDDPEQASTISDVDRLNESPRQAAAPEQEQANKTLSVTQAEESPFEIPTEDTPPTTETHQPAPAVEDIPVLEPETRTNTAQHQTIASDVDIDLLIQELVDEMVPVMEDRLRQRLASYPADIIRELANKYLKE